MRRGVTRWAGTTVLCAGLLISAAMPGALASAGAATRSGASFPSAPSITNPYFPLQPGTTYLYDGTTGSRPEHEVLKVTRTVRTITGVPSVQVLDSNFVAGTVVEATLDWYAQDFDGNVWYMGEYATQYENGQPVGHEGSWLAGRDGAKAGIIMEAHPRVGDVYRQEYLVGVAEDMAKVLAVDASVSTPFGTWINDAVLTRDFTPLDSGVEHKYYAPNFGLVKSQDVKGGAEVLELTGVRRL